MRDEKIEINALNINNTPMTRFQHFQQYKYRYEAGALCLFFLLNSVVLATSRIMEEQRGDNALPFRVWEPFVWELSSVILIIVLIPGVIWLIDSRYSQWSNLKRTALIYAAASLLFSVVHVAGMVLIRKVVYWTQSMHYDFGSVGYEFFYEYRKDVFTFLLIIAVTLSYRFIFSRLQGEANIVANGEDDETPNYDRILVKKLGKEFIVKIEDIEWIESSGNYVNLHIGNRIYPTRNTLASFISEIADKGFCRIHRSFGVNLDEVESISPVTSGTGELTLKSGKVLRLSRRYHDELRQRLQ